ncbi:DNA polymerase epsilon subunit 3-like [Haliotis rufescens]|uniref:DNA polymerase epsilon subunit 3-like n=2 Tax=Haliotis TaxID=6452 RepID=UPI00201FADD1|nr:DNA polymerase epsilon subunit 3-like [Haliotis rufescens]XP_046376387.2 DNA polymerase epsilon subunit 3-like [Haliotis rufescens]
MAERPEDLNLPNAVVTRIIKDAIPDGVNVGKEARLAISKAASVFVLYATSCSNNFSMKAKRKTISAQDVVDAMEEMEFEQFVSPLQQCLDAFRNEQKGKKEASERRKKEREQNASLEEDKNGDTTMEEDGAEVITINGDDEEEEEEGEEGGEEEEEPEEGDDDDVQEIVDDA